MSKKLFKEPRWSYQSMRKELIRFDKLYKLRPIYNNKGGMLYSHMFALYYILRKIKPKFVVESGIYRGQSTWLIEKTLPKSKILSLDLYLNKRTYISKSKNVTYSDKDFKFQNFKSIPKNSLAFFDDHQNSIERVMQSNFFGIEHLVFEDNYSKNDSTEDMYSLKSIFSNSGFVYKFNWRSNLRLLLRFIPYILKKNIFKKYYAYIDSFGWSLRDVPPNKSDSKNLEKKLEYYFEFPPTFKPKLSTVNRPILNSKYRAVFPQAYSEAHSYNNITYLKLK